MVAEEGRARYIHSRGVDTAVAWCWVPIAALAHVLEPNRTAINLVLSAVFLLSFSHQPLTMALVYGDPEQFHLRRALFTWSPLVFALAIVVGINVSLGLVAIVAGLWNAEHTLMQRYGLTRIYGRKAGDDHGAIERIMLLSWLALALVWVAADSRTPGLLDRVDLGATNQTGVSILQSLQAPARLLLPLSFAIALGSLALWLRAERAHARAIEPRTGVSIMKYQYVASTAALFTAILIDPIAGFSAYVAAHAIEYFVIVHRTLGSRYKTPLNGSPLGRAVRTSGGRPAFYVIYIGSIVGLMAVVARIGSPTLYSVAFLGFGGLHVFYDGFIWKLRRAPVANSFAIGPAPASRRSTALVQPLGQR